MTAESGDNFTPSGGFGSTYFLRRASLIASPTSWVLFVPPISGVFTLPRAIVFITAFCVSRAAFRIFVLFRATSFPTPSPGMIAIRYEDILSPSVNLAVAFDRQVSALPKLYHTAHSPPSGKVSYRLLGQLSSSSAISGA